LVLQNHRSEYLSRSQSKALFEAGAFAYCCDRPLNQFVTIHLHRAGVDLPQHFISRLLKLFGDWLHRNAQISSYWLWVLENPPATEEKCGGLNLHILFHVPFDLIDQFRKRMRVWLKMSGGKRKPGVLNFRSAEHSKPGSDPALYLQHGLLGLLRYFAKAIEPQAASDFGIEPKHQGIIFGKRWGHSEALGEQHRWLPDHSRRSNYITGRSSLARRYAKAVCPDLFEFPPYKEED